MTTPGPSTTSTTWAHRLASLIHEIRPDWDEAGIRAVLAQCGGRHLALVAFEAVAAAITRPDQRSPAIIAMDGRHRHLLDPPGTPVATVHPLVCEHDQRPSRCPECTGRGVPCPEDLRARMRSDVISAKALQRAQAVRTGTNIPRGTLDYPEDLQGRQKRHNPVSLPKEDA